jgi:hypothetical protein
MTESEFERRVVRSADPSLSDEANRLLTGELREIVGREVVDVPVGRADPADAVHTHRRRLVAMLIAARFGIGFVLIGVACVLGVIGLVWNTTAALVAAVVVLIAGTLAFLSLFMDLVSETEHPAPETAALLQAEGVGDPDRLLEDLVEEFRAPEDD